MTKSNSKCRSIYKLMTISVIFTFCFVGCMAPMQSREVKSSGFLGDYSCFKDGQSGQPQRFYINPETHFKTYSRMILDPITIHAAPESSLSKLPQKEIEALQSYLYWKLKEELSKDYVMVDQAGPGTMRLRTALTEAKSENVARNIISSILPIGLAISALKLAATGTHTAVGEADIEIELVDSETGKRLAAAVDGRAGRKAIVSGNFTRWGDVQDAFDFWAEKTRLRLEELRKK